MDRVNWLLGADDSTRRMAGHTVSPGLFKSKDAEPEATLELFSGYCEVIERVFRLRRRLHPATGDKIEFDDAEKKDLIIVEGGDDMQKLFKHVGQVVEQDNYVQAVVKRRPPAQSYNRNPLSCPTERARQ